MTAPTTTTTEQRPAPPPAPRRIPEWMRRMQAGQLKAKDLTGSVAL
jgi:hypothetical protein